MSSVLSDMFEVRNGAIIAVPVTVLYNVSFTLSLLYLHIFMVDNAVSLFCDGCTFLVMPCQC